MKPVCVGIKGRVLGLDRKTGRSLWEIHLAGNQFVNVHWEGKDLIAATRGEVFCLGPRNGSIKWKNGLPGMGWGVVTIAGSNSNTEAVAEHLRRQQQAAQGAGAGTTGAMAAR